jgi:antitoxin (DNA-binding transcriptional repressor) of toxin-antitoxin stability system
MGDSETGIYTIGDLGARAPAVIAEIRERGKTALITDHGRFAAAITPFKDGEVGTQALGEMVRELQERLDILDGRRLCSREIMMEGARSAPASPADAAYFDGLRSRIRREYPG